MKKLDFDNLKWSKMLTATCARAWWHKKRRVRKKNYARAQRMLDVKRIRKKLGLFKKGEL